MEARAARRVHSARALLAGGGAVTGLGLGPGLGVAGGSRGWDAPGAPWRQRWRRRRRRPGDELAPRRGEPVEPGRRAEAAAQAERRPEPERRAPTMAAQGEPGYQAAQSDPGSNSERSTDSPMPGSEDDLVAGAPLHSPEWSEERFRVDRKKLEAMLQGRHPPLSPTPHRSPYSFPDIPVPRPAPYSSDSRLSSPVPSPAELQDTQGVKTSRDSPPFHTSPVFRHREPCANLTRLQKSQRPSLYRRARVVFLDTLEMPTLVQTPGLCHQDPLGPHRVCVTLSPLADSLEFYL